MLRIVLAVAGPLLAVPAPHPTALPAPHPAALPAAEPPAMSWHVDLGRPDPAGAVVADTGVRRHGGALRLSGGASYGQSVLAPRTLLAPAGRVGARLHGSVPAGTAASVEVRGERGGQWSEWRETAAGPAEVVPRASRIQVRVALWGTHGAGPALTGLDLVAEPGGPERRRAPVVAATHRVFATRIGLAGARTANGHRIGRRDHFAALPTRRSLSGRGGGDYTVRVCAAGRCEYAPVWDVGPWNTRDDYWNPPTVRQMWQDLPPGVPQAQAAHRDGYHGGLDQFGRRVGNPAGIDLADGMFRDGLGLRDNAWVDVTYLWTAPPGPAGTVQAPLRVRAGPYRTARIVGLAAPRARVPVQCQVTGDAVRGPFGSSTLWNRVGQGHFVSDAFVDTGSRGRVAPPC